MRMREHGLQDRENSRLYTKKPKCGGSGGNFITASLVDTKPAVLVYVWITLLAFILLAMEIVYKRLQERTRIREHRLWRKITKAK